MVGIQSDIVTQFKLTKVERCNARILNKPFV